MNDPDDEIPRAALDAYAPPEPPPDFAARVLAARRAERVAVRPRSRLAIAVGASLLAASLLAAILLRPGAPVSVDGARTAAARETLAIGRRAVAVAEAGAALRWHVAERGDARVEQSGGDVFYRVEHGGPFVVTTPAGDVRVLGTCFRVEVRPMAISKQAMMAAGVGAVAATTVLVSVYEGRVLLANEHGKTELTAGERANARPGQAPSAKWADPTAGVSAPVAAPAEGITRDELLARDATQRAELDRLRARVHTLEVGGPSNAAAAAKPPERPFYEMTKEELNDLAKDCKLRWDTPKIGLNPQTMSEKRAGELGLSDQERLEYDRVTAEMDRRVVGDLRALYVEVTGDKAGADTLTPQALETEILDKSPPAAVQSAFWKLSHERAGQLPAGDGKSGLPVERLLRELTGLGDQYERDLGAAIGPDQAHQLRAERKGWGSQHQSSYGCPDSH